MRLLLLWSLLGCAFAQWGDVFAAIKLDSPKDLRAALAAAPEALNTPGPGGQTPLMNAVLTGKPETALALLKLGADVTAGEKDGYTPMHGAGFQGRFDMVQMLMDYGVPIDGTAHRDGFTPVERACWGREARHTQTVQRMLSLGAAGLKSVAGCKTNRKETQKLVEDHFSGSEDL